MRVYCTNNADFFLVYSVSPVLSSSRPASIVCLFSKYQSAIGKTKVWAKIIRIMSISASCRYNANDAKTPHTNNQTNCSHLVVQLALKCKCVEVHMCLLLPMFTYII